MGVQVALRVAVVVAMLVATAAALDGGPRQRRERRMSEEELDAVFKRLDSTKEDSPCNPPASSDFSNAMPTLPDSFTTELEIAHQEEGKKKVLYGAEAFDGVFNMGYLRYELSEGIADSRPYDKQEIIHYDTYIDESLIITTNTACEDEGQGNCDPKKSCKARKLSAVHTELWELFGLGNADGSTGYYGISGILQWTKTLPYTYNGRATCRGIDCETFEICIKNKGDDISAKIMYYWSAANWTVDSNSAQIPLAIEVTSNGRVSPYFSRTVKQRYDFYEFYSNIRPDFDLIAPPADVYCSNRDSIYDPPKAPRFFSYFSETVAPINFDIYDGENQTRNVEYTVAFSHYGYYDWTSKVSFTDFIPVYVFGGENRYEHEMRHVQDFNQGISYYLYKHRDVCHMFLIENITTIGNVVVNKNGSVTMLPPWQFVELDGAWQYNGEHQARGAEADVWVGEKNLLSFLLREYYVTYYASPLTFEETLRESPTHATQGVQKPRVMKVPGGKWPEGRHARKKKATRAYVSMDSVPMVLMRYLNTGEGKPHTIVNIYDYQTQPPFTQSIDISRCYTDDRRRHFLLELPSDALDQVKGLEDNLLHATQMALADVGVVSPLRINREKLEFRDGKTYVLFTLLPLPPMVGDSIGAMEENDLDTAADSIISSVSNHKMVIVVHLDGIFISVEPLYVPLNVLSINEVSRGDDNTYTVTRDRGYSSGDMAGLAVGMVVAGVLVGVVAGMVWQWRAGSKGALPRVSMARKSPLSPSNTISINSDLTASDI